MTQHRTITIKITEPERLLLVYALGRIDLVDQRLRGLGADLGDLLVELASAKPAKLGPNGETLRSGRMLPEPEPEVDAPQARDIGAATAVYRRGNAG